MDLGKPGSGQMKTIPVNFIGYGHWGSRLAKRVEQEGFQIENLVTNKTDNIEVKYTNLISRNDIERVDKTLPTFIATGPLYHFNLIKMFDTRVFVEKPYYHQTKENYSLKYEPYVNYHWYNSLKLRTIKDIISTEWEQLEVELYSSHIVDRGIEIVKDFFPHIISILKYLVRNEISLLSIEQISNTLYVGKFNNNITFKFGITECGGAKFRTNKCLVETYSPNTITYNNTIFTLDRDPISETIYRYYNYYLSGSCSKIFIDNEFHNLVYNFTN
jgi:hypothetical protein